MGCCGRRSAGGALREALTAWSGFAGFCAREMGLEAEKLLSALGSPFAERVRDLRGLSARRHGVEPDPEGVEGYTAIITGLWFGVSRGTQGQTLTAADRPHGVPPPRIRSPGESNGVFEAGGTVPVKFWRKDDDTVAEDCERSRPGKRPGFRECTLPGAPAADLQECPFHPACGRCAGAGAAGCSAAAFAATGST